MAEVESCISCSEEKRNEKIQYTHSIMANLNLGQNVANNSENRKQTAAHIVAKSYPLWQAVGIHRYGSLANINLSGQKQ